MSNEITPYIDTAQVALYMFFIFFAGLIVWLRSEDRREGYPLESETRAVVFPQNGLQIPRPKEFLLPHGEGVRAAPNFERDRREIRAERVSPAPGSPLEPTGDALLSEVGPASYVERSHHPELSQLDGTPVVIPMRVAAGFSVNAGPDPRGWRVLGADGAVAGVISDIWVDRADLMVRYLEVQLPAVATAAGPAEGEGEVAAVAAPALRLIPIVMLGLDARAKAVRVHALRADQFAHVPTLANPEQITVDEEERVSAFYAGGWFYAEPRRRESMV